MLATASSTSGSVTKAIVITKAALAGAILTFVIALAVYSATLAPTVTFVDSGELIVAAKYLGVAHPPGTPLYVLLAHLFTLLPFGNVAVRVNFASALFAALAASVTTLLLSEMLAGLSLPAPAKFAGEIKRRKKVSKDAAASIGAQESMVPSRGLKVLMPALGAGLLLAFSRTLWSFATIAEVYTLNTLLIVVVFFLMFRWRRLREAEQEQKRQTATSRKQSEVVAGKRTNTWLLCAAFFFGLALGVHHVTVGVTLPALAVLVYRTEGWQFFKSKRLLYAALISFAALLLVYSYLPFAASRSPIIAWGDPRTLQRIWWHISGRQYQVFITFSIDRMANQAAAFLRLAANEFGPWWLPLGLFLAALGLVDSFRRDRTTCYFLVLIIIADLAYALNYEIAEDKGAYYLPAFIAFVIAAGTGAHRLIQYAVEKWRDSQPAFVVVSAAVLLAPICAFGGNLAVNNRHQYFLARDYVSNIESTIAHRGMLLTSDWQAYSPLLYTREIEGQRRDIIAIDVNMLRRSWYFDYLKREYPELIQQTRERVEAFLEDLKAWEQDPASFERSSEMTQRIDSRFHEMIAAFIGTQLRTGPVYATNDVALETGGGDPGLAAEISRTYKLAPQGLVFQLTSGVTPAVVAEPKLEMRGLFDDTLEFDADDVVSLKVKPVYLNMMLNRGRYFVAHADYQRAIKTFREALELDPSFAAAQQDLSKSLDAVRAHQ